MQPNPTTTAPATSRSEDNPTSIASTTRLYISPFTSDLFNTIVSPALQASATDVSYHSVEAFPENSYGYLTLPADEAQKLRRKYHSSILRGTKMRIEEARPERKQRKRKAAAEQAENNDHTTAGATVGEEADVDERAAEEIGERRSKRSRRAKQEEGVLQGVELPEGRHVKRGWTGESSKEKKKGRKGKSDDDDNDGGDTRGKMLFKANAPPNKASDLPDTKKNKRKNKDETANKKGKITTVKEFEQTTVHPSFLKENEISDKPAQATTFEEGKGWVDGEGNVVESVETRSTRKRRSKDVSAAADSKDGAEPSGRKSKKSEKSTRDDKDSTQKSPVQDQPSIVVSEEPPERNEPSRERSTSKHRSPIPSTETAAGQPEDTTTDQTSILESLFKRPKPKSSKKGTSPQPTQEPFSFFSNTADNTNDEDDPSSKSSSTLFPPRPPHKRKTSNNSGTRPTPLQIDTSSSTAAQKLRNRGANNANGSRSNSREGSTSTTAAERAAIASRETTFTLPPATPFTRRDMETRGMRSAAPTPDTAAIGKRVWPPWRRGSTRGSSGVRDENSMTPADEEEEVEDGKVVAAGAATGGDGEPSEEEESAEEGENEFEKKFRAKKGVYAKGWKANRRTAKKEQRQAENRRRGVRGKN
ncbi:MAG: hypothetical protein M1831_000839 [Alyxoria varia]|nr:MAG: hypothetical protein M1831_000839 [Alyxoria varia]